MAYDMGQTGQSLHTAGNKSNRKTAIITVGIRVEINKCPFSHLWKKKYCVLLLHNSWIHIMMLLTVANQKLYNTCIVHVTHTYILKQKSLATHYRYAYLLQISTLK